MKNIFKSLFSICVAILCTSPIWADTKTYDFSTNTFAADWTVDANVPSGGTGACEQVSSLSSFPATNAPFMGMSFLNKSGITIKVTTTASYANISNIAFRAVSNDNSKPSWTVRIVDNNGNELVKLLDAVGSKNEFATGGTNKWGSWTGAVSGTPTGHLQFELYASSSGKYAALDDIVITYSGTTGGGGTTTTYSITYNNNGHGTAPATATGQTTLPATLPTMSESGWTFDGWYTDAALTTPAVAGATLTANTTLYAKWTEDAPVASNDATLKDIRVNGQTITGFAANTTTYNVQIPYSSTTAATITATPTSSAATAVVTGYNTVEGTATITVTAEDGTTTKIYTVNITKAAPSTDANLKELKYNGTSVPNFSANTLTYSVELPYGTTAAAQVTATANYSAANVQITQPTAAVGSATIVVIAEDGTQKTYTITFTVAEEDVPPVPSTTLTLHTPGTYEEKTLAGGYETPLTVLSGREYEVYYAGRDANSALTITTTPAIKTDGICSTRTSSGCKAQDGWLEVSEPLSSPSTYTVVAQDEFAAGNSAIHKIQGGYYKMHIKGYDQFSIYAMDNNTDKSKNKYIEVRVDDVLQDMTLSTTATVRRFNLTTGEHVIEVKGLGSSNDQVIAFSLRVAQEPRLKKIKGNDSTQVVLQTQAPKPITYFTKYNSMGRTELEWDGPAATGITLTTGNTSALGDTLILGGTALCPVGTYHFHVVAYNAANKETSRESGSFSVASKIAAQTDTIITAYTNEAMDEIKFRYYALDASDITIEWQPSAPAGITASGTNGIYTITGTPTQTGTYNYTVTVAGGNTIPGQIKVLTLDLGNNPILYLYKNNLAYEKDGIYQYLTQDQHLNLIARKAKSELRPADQYNPYTLIIISEDVDATNPEVLAIARGEGQQKPVLNLKSFTYSPNRLDWGEPDNGSLINREITVIRADHPIFTAMGKKAGDKIAVLDTIITKGLMPAAVDYQGTLCLATAYTRGRDYMSSGDEETFLHEVPASMRGGAKYICMPIALYSSNNLSTEGKRLVNATIGYLRGTAASVALPELQITAATVNGTAINIDQTKDEMVLTMTDDATLDLEKMNCTFTLKDNKTHATYVDYSGDKHMINLQGEVIDLSDTRNGVTITVTDYINVRHYTLRIDLLTALDEAEATNEWVNIYDIQGRLVTTTNDIRHLQLERGMYVVVGAHGSYKIMR